MDTKLKKRKMAVSFGIFFLSISLLLGSGALLGKQALNTAYWRDVGLSGLMEQDYQNTKGFRNYMQGRLETFLTIAAGTKAKDLEYAKAYHEEIRRNQNLLYRISRNGRELYSNMDGIQGKEGYNFQLVFNGKTVSIEKDGEKLDVYGDGYYRDSSQWYVPGYKNFTADAGLENVEIQILAAKEPVMYSFVNSGDGYYTRAENRLYSLFEAVQQNHASLRLGMAGLAAGAILLAVFLLGKSLRNGKKEADNRLAQLTSRIWFEAKLAVFFLLAAGLWGILGNAAFSGNIAYSGFQTGMVIHDSDYYNALEMMDLLETDWVTDGMTEQEAEAEWGLAEVEATTEESPQEQHAWTQWLAGPDGWHIEWQQLGSSILANPAVLLAYFWLLYLLANDISKNRGHFLDGIIRRSVQKARMDNMKQPFAVLQMKYFLLAAAVGIAAVAAELLAAGLSHMGFFNHMETVLAQCLILAAFLAALYYCLTRVKQQAEELDLLAEHIQAVQSGDYTEKESLPKDSCLKPLSDGLTQIRQGMEAAVGEQLKSERMKVELVANVSHDLKTPLTSIISYLAFLKQEEDLPDHVRDYIRILDEKAQRLNSIVQDVFAVSKAASGQLPVELEELDFGKLLQQTLADMEEQIQAGTVTIKTDFPQEAVRITADGTRLYRVFQNLVQNALRYSLEGSRVFVSLNCEGDYAVASIKNISRQELRAGADFTERFVRGDASRTDGGAGLGLSIAKSFTEACGGKFSLETNADLFVVKVGFSIR